MVVHTAGLLWLRQPVPRSHKRENRILRDSDARNGVVMSKRKIKKRRKLEPVRHYIRECKVDTGLPAFREALRQLTTGQLDYLDNEETE